MEGLFEHLFEAPNMEKCCFTVAKPYIWPMSLAAFALLSWIDFGVRFDGLETIFAAKNIEHFIVVECIFP